jgi:paraquat-inducible protein B
VQVFIESPYESLVTRNSRFWNASGVDLSLDARGLTVNTQSLASVIGGGVAFASPRRSSATPPAPEGQRFTLFGSQQQALAPPDGQPLRIRMRFQQSSRGLAVGAPIDLLGVDIGSVRSVTLQYDEAGMRFPVEVIADIDPGRLGAVRSRVIEAQEASSPLPEDDLFMKRLIDAGLRAQLRTANLLTGQLFVALDFMPRAPKVVVDESKEVLAMPTVPGTLSELQPQLAQIISRLGQVRFDRIGNELEGTLKNAGAASLSLKQTLADAGVAIKQLSPEAQRALADVQKTLASMQATLEAFDHGVTDPESALQRNANQALVELQRTAEALRVLSDYIQQHPESLLRGKPADRDVTKSTGGSK